MLILVSEQEEIDETEWLKSLSRNPAFDFLNDPAEDNYKATDGKPFHDEK